MKAVFVYNFLKYIHWPSEHSINAFTIGVMNDAELYEEILNISKIKKSIGNQVIVVKKVENYEEPVQLLFVGRAYEGTLSPIINMAKNNHTLLVTDIKGGMAKGFAIELIIASNQAEFDISKKHLKECKLSVSQQLLDMARTIE
jgi:hypothetical protein